jgi:predicted RNase H-like HicB family nuclease
MPSYIALLRMEPDTDYAVEVPDFLGCVSAGKDLEEAQAMAEEALELHLEGMIADGDPLPATSGLEEILADPENRQTIAPLVTVPAQPTETVHLDLALPETTLREVEARASSRGLIRSAFLAEVTLNALKRSA